VFYALIAPQIIISGHAALLSMAEVQILKKKGCFQNKSNPARTNRGKKALLSAASFRWYFLNLISGIL
jgi:hypothetical protein